MLISVVKCAKCQNRWWGQTGICVYEITVTSFRFSFVPFFLVTSLLHSRAFSRPETSCLLSVFNLHTLANTVCLLYLRLTCIPSSSKEKLLYLVIPGISLFPTAAAIFEVSILQTATRVPVILVEILVHFSRCLPSPCHCFLIRNFSDVTCMAQFCGQ